MSDARMGPVKTLAAQLANFMWLFAMANRKKGRAPKPEDFNPYESGKAHKAGIPLTRENVGLLKKAFVKRGKGGGP